MAAASSLAVLTVLTVLIALTALDVVTASDVVIALIVVIASDAVVVTAENGKRFSCFVFNLEGLCMLQRSFIINRTYRTNCCTYDDKGSLNETYEWAK